MEQESPKEAADPSTASRRRVVEIACPALACGQRTIHPRPAEGRARKRVERRLR
jgi:hypothetical protein